MKTLKSKNYERDSAISAENIESFYKSSRDAASKVLHASAIKAAKRLASQAEENGEFEDPASETVKKDAAKHILKLIGMEVQKVEHSGEIDFQPVRFSDEEE